MSQQDLINLILKQTQALGCGVAVWDEADSMAGFLVRMDGKVVGLGDYQSVGNNEESTLDKLDKHELGRIASDLQHWASFDQEHRLSLAHMNFIQGQALQETGDFHYMGPTPPHMFNTDISLLNDVSYRDGTGMVHTLAQGGQFKAMHVQNTGCRVQVGGVDYRDEQFYIQDPNGSKNHCVRVPFDAVGPVPRQRMKM